MGILCYHAATAVHPRPQIGVVEVLVITALNTCVGRGCTAPSAGRRRSIIRGPHHKRPEPADADRPTQVGPDFGCHEKNGRFYFTSINGAAQQPLWLVLDLNETSIYARRDLAGYVRFDFMAVLPPRRQVQKLGGLTLCPKRGKRSIVRSETDEALSTCTYNPGVGWGKRKRGSRRSRLVERGRSCCCM